MLPCNCVGFELVPVDRMDLGFPLPIFSNHAHTSGLEDAQVQSKVTVLTDITPCNLPLIEQHLGVEGARVWKDQFAPKNNSKTIIQVPVDWVNFLSVTFLSPDKFD